MQCRDVAVADERLGAHARQRLLHAREQPRRAVPAADAPDPVDIVVEHRAHEIVAALLVVARHVAGARQCMRPDLHLPTERFRVADGPLEFVRAIERPRRAHHRHPCPHAERRRLTQRGE